MRDPHSVLGLEPGATQAQIKAAWRRLAREHHPDLAAGNPAEARRATRRMAEINAAYERLRGDGRRGPNGAARTDARQDAYRAAGGGAERGSGARSGRPTGPPPPPRTRPVTGRVDTSATFRPRNATTTRSIGRISLAGLPGLKPLRSVSEAPRASDPTGPSERSRLYRFRPRPQPSLPEASAFELPFGKFRGHTLGEVAAFEPSYVDWLARTIDRDPELLAAARVIRADLDARGVVRRDRSSEARRSPLR